VALWELGYVCAYVRVRKWGCGSGSILTLERDLQLNDPCLVDTYQASLIHHNVGIRVDALYAIDPSIWASHHETQFNTIDRDVERAVKCAANCCRRKSYRSTNGQPFPLRSSTKCGSGNSDAKCLIALLAVPNKILHPSMQPNPHFQPLSLLHAIQPLNASIELLTQDMS
jgi:hypothetical protein